MQAEDFVSALEEAGLSCAQFVAVTEQNVHLVRGV
jgi:hypothetical protein